MRAAAVAVALCCACGARTGLGVPIAEDASSPPDAAADVRADAPADAAADAGPDAADAAPEAAPPCDFGTIVSDAFGAIVTWNGGAPVPAGHYRVTYVDGCMKYSSGQDWSVNAYANGPDTLYVVDGDGAKIAPAPGTVGFLQGQGGFATFDACVSANASQDAPLVLDWDGGAIGLELYDDPYDDNVAGENGRNPTYRLSSCP